MDPSHTAAPLRLRSNLGLIALLELPLILMSFGILIAGLDSVLMRSYSLAMSAAVGYLLLGYGLYAFKILLALGRIEGKQAWNILVGNAAYYLTMWAGLCMAILSDGVSSSKLQVLLGILPLALLGIWYAQQRHRV